MQKSRKVSRTPGEPSAQWAYLERMRASAAYAAGLRGVSPPPSPAPAPAEAPVAEALDRGPSGRKGRGSPGGKAARAPSPSPPSGITPVGNGQTAVAPSPPGSTKKTVVRKGAKKRAPGKTSASTDASRKSERVIIRTIGLRKVYTQKTVETIALDGVDVEIYGSEFLSVMGPSGSGKSTFFNMIGGLDSPSSGRVFIDEVDVAQLTAVELAFLRCHKIGYIFQQYNLIQYMTALENVTTPMTFAGVPPDEARRRGMEILGLVGLADRWFHRPIEMSGGQQQRVAIARAMANWPAILLCDEPTANLDFNTGMEILRILQKLNQERGVTIICATHDHRMLDICDRLMWIRDGQIERVARRDEVTIQLGSVGGET